MKLIVGLGNPGRNFKGTRHNVGFEVVDKLATKYRIKWRRRRRFRSSVGEGIILGEKVLLAKPLTFVNLSGEAISLLLKRRGVKVEDLVVVYDDADLPLGTLRLREKGGSGGHKGMLSIISSLHSRDFPRLRIGIGRHTNRELEEYVLEPFTEEERAIVQDMLEKAVGALEAIIEEGLEKAMNKVN